MITNEEVDAMIDAARLLHGATFPSAHLHLQQVGIDVAISRANENGRPGAYVSDTVVLDEYAPDRRREVVDLAVRCAERAHRRRLAVSAWNLSNGRPRDALAAWSVWMHEAVRMYLVRHGVDLEKALAMQGPDGNGEIASMGAVDLNGSAYLYDAGWAGLTMTVSATALPTTLVQALPGRTLGETIAHPDLPTDLIIRSARMQDGDLRLGLAPRYAPMAPAPRDADMAWREIGVPPWQRADFVARPVEQ